MKWLRLCALLVLCVLLFSSCSGMDSDAKRASEILIANFPYFDSPESLRFVSGTGELKRDVKGYVDGLLYACLEVENAQGVKEIGYYVLCISYDDHNGHIVDPVKYPNYYMNKAYFEKQDIPPEEVNEFLAAHFEQQ